MFILRQGSECSLAQANKALQLIGAKTRLR